MNVSTWDSLVEGKAGIYGETALTVGVFDGLHLGHQSLIAKIVQSGLIPTVITFRVNPLRVLKPSDYPGDILSIRQKIALLKELGVQNIIVIDFSLDFSTLSGREFLEIVRKNLELRYMALGINFKCGYNKDTNAEKVKFILTQHNIKVDIVEPVYWEDSIISSTRIRKAILEGNFLLASQMLGREFVLEVPDQVQYTLHEACLEKNQLHQVLPEKGNFQVTLIDGSSTHDSEMEIFHDFIRWTQADNFKAMKIVFI
ncbi:MAG: FAD synthetase family protein [Spirochaetota bacterium]